MTLRCQIAAGVFLLSGSMALGAEHTIEIAGFKFKGPQEPVHVGDTLVFINKDVVPHTASQRPEGWDSGSLVKGASWQLVVDRAGSFDYACKFHPNMKAKLVVEP